MPAHKKLLPLPCPQCGQENGGMQIIIFNPRFSNYKLNEKPYSILRISHYNKKQYNSSPKEKKKNNTKVWHNFRVSLNENFSIVMRNGKKIKWKEVFNDPYYYRKKSITLPKSKIKDNFESIKKNGWSHYIAMQKAHFKNKSLKYLGE